jgi:hypothetical protein
MVVGERNMARGMDLGVSYPNFQDWRDAQRSFIGLAAWDGATMNVSDEGRTAERYAARTSRPARSR